MENALDPAVHGELVQLGRQLYERALVRRDSEHLTDPHGRPIGWLLDTRVAILRSDVFREVGEVMAARLQAYDVAQVAGFGFGAFALVGSVLGSTKSGSFTGGLIRESKKKYGRRRLVEGPLNPSEPVALLDDILNSGRSAVKAISLLREDGFNVVGLATLFNFTWSEGRKRVESRGLWVDSLLDLNLKQGRSDMADSDSLA